ncbi:MAG: PAS-domain containing protein [Gemmobacter sp.]|jgi:PAS domain-containing protein|nr:PAS-domain containing protein [Gemmobacter sp.]
MMGIDWPQALVLITAASLAAIGAVLLLSLLQRREAEARGMIFRDQEGGTSFLFDGETLLGATPGAQALLNLSPGGTSPWERLTAWLAMPFPDFPVRIDAIRDEGMLTLTSTGREAPLLLRAEYRGGLTRISLLDPDEQAAQPGPDALIRQAVDEELLGLRTILARAPMPIWREGPEGEITWANTEYLLRVADRLSEGEDLSWPLPRLFERTGTARRQMLALAQSAPQPWFDLHERPEDGGAVVYALPADELMRTESSRDGFHQTLGKTFADLSIGLAVFDRNRRLVMFNPAMNDLCGLNFEFLAKKPSLFAFLDAMREQNMIPEPRNYRVWRQQMMALERAAASGLFEETWSLPSGHTYRVIGRPHPDGTMALLFEDISPEMSRQRRYRADLELNQAVLDTVDEALAVFSPSAALVMSNSAYAGLWGHDPSANLADGGLAVLCQHWRAQSAPSPFWAEAEAFALGGNRAPQLESTLRLRDGRPLHCRMTALPGGATLVRFRLAPAVEAASQARKHA